MTATPIYNVSNQAMPDGCIAQVIGYVSPLSGQATDTLDVTTLIRQNHINGLQSIFVDNADNAQSISITAQTTNQRLVIPANSQAWLPMFIAPGSEAFTLASTGGVDIRIFLCNVPMPACVWSV